MQPGTVQYSNDAYARSWMRPVKMQILGLSLSVLWPLAFMPGKSEFESPR